MISRVVLPVPTDADKGSISVLREDTNGNTFTVVENVSPEFAKALISALTANVHKQYYWTEDKTIKAARQATPAP